MHTEFRKQALITLVFKDATKCPDSMYNLRRISLLEIIKRLVGRIITDRLFKVAAEAKQTNKRLSLRRDKPLFFQSGLYIILNS